MILLGSTGSIGVNALAIAERFGLHVEVLGAGRNIELLNRQIKRFNPSIVVIQEPSERALVDHPRVLIGQEGIVEAIRNAQSDLVINAIVGFAGLRATLEALTCKKRIALANKESLVVAGAFLDTSEIIPIDSEHFGLWYLYDITRPIERMVITASGGAFRDWPLERLQEATLKDALRHPNWSMGRKITIDSATMANKLFELLEARWLFGEGDFDAIIETRSLIHALIDYRDGSTTAHLARADMQLPIAFALLGSVQERIVERVDLLACGALEFRPIDAERYPIWSLKEDLLRHPKRGVIVNAANEAAIERFIASEIGFMQIARLTLDAYAHFNVEATEVDALFSLDEEVRRWVKER